MHAARGGTIPIDMAASPVFVGINGNVFCLDPATGEALWYVELKGADFVNVVVDGDVVLASTKGQIWCLDAATGSIRWHNELRGQGRGLATIATATASSPLSPLREKRRRDEEAAAAAATTAASS